MSQRWGKGLGFVCVGLVQMLFAAFWGEQCRLTLQSFRFDAMQWVWDEPSVRVTMSVLVENFGLPNVFAVPAIPIAVLSVILAIGIIGLKRDGSNVTHAMLLLQFATGGAVIVSTTLMCNIWLMDSGTVPSDFLSIEVIRQARNSSLIPRWVEMGLSFLILDFVIIGLAGLVDEFRAVISFLLRRNRGHNHRPERTTRHEVVLTDFAAQVVVVEATADGRRSVRTPLNRYSLDELFARLLGDGKAEAFQELRERMTTAVSERFRLAAKPSFQTGAQAISATASRSLDEVIAHPNRDADLDHALTQAREAAEAIVRTNLDRYRQEVGQQAEQKFGAGFRNFQEHLVTLLDEAIGKSEYWTSEQQLPPVLPVGTRFFSQNGNRSLVVVEQAPMVRSIVFKDATAQRYTLSLPYVIFTLTFAGKAHEFFHVFFSNVPIKRWQQSLFEAPFPNVSQNRRGNYIGHVCFGTNLYERVAREGQLSDVTDAMINDFWNSEFNTHMQDEDGLAGIGALDPRLRSFGSWHAHSKTHPSFSLTVPWIDTGETLDSLAKRVLSFDPKMNVGGPTADHPLRRLVQQVFEVHGDLLAQVELYLRDVPFRPGYPKATMRQLQAAMLRLRDAMLKSLQTEWVKAARPVRDELQKAIENAFLDAMSNAMHAEFQELERTVLVRRRGDFPALIE